MPWSDMYNTYAAYCDRAGGRLAGYKRLSQAGFRVASLCHQADHVKTD